MRYQSWLAAFGLVGLAVPAFAQPGTGGTITHTNATYTSGDSPTTGTGSGPTADFRVGGAGNPDHLIQDWWWTRSTTNDVRELANSNATSPSWSGRVGQLEFNEAASNLRIVRTYLVTGLGDGRGVISESTTVTNTSAGNITADVFHFIDPSLGGVSSGISAALNGSSSIKLTSGVWTAFYEGSGTYQAGGASSVLSLLTNATVNNFNNTGLPFGPGDVEAGFQWTFNLGAGQSATATMSYTIVPAPGAAAILGLAGVIGSRRRRR